MHGKELNRATIEVASSIDISGRATADEIKRGLESEEKRGFWRIGSSAIPGYLPAVGLLVALLAPLPASAEDAGGIPAEIAALKALVASLQSTVSALQKQVNNLQSSNTTLQKQLATVQSNHALLLGPFVNVDPNPEIGVIGPNIIFSGANIHIVSGSGATNDNGNPTGLGNLIIGYDEDPRLVLPNPLEPGDRGGSHNLVIGGFSRFTRAAYGGIVAGQANVISNAGASVTGGEENTASGFFSSVSSGVGNTASGLFTSVTGGGFNSASGDEATVSGGASNTAFDDVSSVTGGTGNTVGNKATFPFLHFGSSIIGGTGNNVTGSNTVVLGGQNVTDDKDNSIAPQPPFH